MEFHEGKLVCEPCVFCGDLQSDDKCFDAFLFRTAEGKETMGFVCDICLRRNVWFLGASGKWCAFCAVVIDPEKYDMSNVLIVENFNPRLGKYRGKTYVYCCSEGCATKQRKKMLREVDVAYRYCEYCKRVFKKLRRCGRCKEVEYCSEECQKLD